MDDSRKQPTDHLPPASDRAADDARTTAQSPYPVDGGVDEGGVSPETAAQPDKPGRHGADLRPPGAR